MRVTVQTAGATWFQVFRHVDHVVFSLQGDHIVALAHQVVARNKRSFVALAVGPRPQVTIGENSGVVQQKEQHTQAQEGRL